MLLSGAWLAKPWFASRSGHRSLGCPIGIQPAHIVFRTITAWCDHSSILVLHGEFCPHRGQGTWWAKGADSVDPVRQDPQTGAKKINAERLPETLFFFSDSTFIA